MKQKIKHIFLGLSFFMAQANGTIAQSDSLNCLEQQFSKLDARDLVVFDMDAVLIVPQDAILHANADEELRRLHFHYAGHLPKQDQLLHGSLIWQQAKTVLVEPHTPSLIAALQKRAIKVIVLTAAPVGKCGAIEDTVAFRIAELQEKGIDLSSSFPHLDTLHFAELGTPTFRQGVILSHHVPKGVVLAAFLKKIDWKPQRLIFIDDIRENHESVESELAPLGISELYCLHYTASEKHVKEINPAVARLQIKTLVNKGIWLSDEQALAILRAG